MGRRYNEDGVVDVVDAGILTQNEWDKLYDAAMARDQSSYVGRLKDICRHNVPAWNALVLDFDVTPHFVGIREELGDARRALVCAPRSHSKSYEYAIGETSHHLAYSLEDPFYEDPRILLIQESATMVEDTIKSIQQLLESGGPKNVIKAMFGDIREKSSKWTTHRVWLGTNDASKDPSLMGAGVGTAITGKHPRFLVGDDLVSKDNSKTPLLRRRIWEWFSETVDGMIDPDTWVRLIYTPYYEDDLHARLEDTKTYHVVKRPAINRQIERDDFDVVENGNGTITDIKLTDSARDIEPLWGCPLGEENCPYPHGWAEHVAEVGQHRPLKWLIEKWLRNPVAFSSQYMLRVVSDEEALVKRDMIRFWAEPNDPRVGKPDWLSGNTVVTMEDDVVLGVHGWDHAIGRSRDSDRTAHAMAYRTADNKVFFAPVKAGRWDFPKVTRMMEQRYYTDPILAPLDKKPKTIVTEGVSFQRAFAEQVDQQSSEILPLEVLKKTTDKAQAFVNSGLAYAMVRGRVFFHVDDEDTVQELLMFTGQNGRFHDDRVDAVRLAFDYIKEVKRKKARVLRTPAHSRRW